MNKDVILLTNNGLGTSKDEGLMSQLLLAYLYTQCNQPVEKLPSHIILYTDAVYLATDTKQISDHFKELISKGVDVVICGACVDYLELNDKINFGRISNMLEIVNIMNDAKKVIRP